MSFQTLQCSIHKIRWETSDVHKMVTCPVCMETTLQEVKNQLLEVTSHRDLLLKAIDLKLAFPASESLRD